jgi:sporulation protein YlmC with PRC-barrel domain
VGGTAWLALGSKEARRVVMEKEKTVPFTIGADVGCADGVCGEVTRVVVDPVARAVTHLVVEPKGRQGLGRLVPIGLVDAADGQIRLRCTRAEFEMLDSAEETQFVPGTGGYAAYGPEQVLSWPYSSLGGGARVAGEEVPGTSQTATYDAVPLGEVAVRRGERVHATDGDIGQVEGLIIDPRNQHVTHVLLQEGHLWGRKEVAIPISAVTGVQDGIRLNVTKREVQDLPPVDIHHPDR